MSTEYIYDENDNDFLGDKSWSEDAWTDREKVRGILGRLKHPFEDDVRKDIVTKLMEVLNRHRGDEAVDRLWDGFTEEFGLFFFEETPFDV